MCSFKEGMRKGLLTFVVECDTCQNHKGDGEDSKGLVTITNTSNSMDKKFNGFYYGYPENRQQISHHGGSWSTL